jgi:hypothetical protein
VESYVYIFESSEMKFILYAFSSLSSILFFSGCELLCQAGTGTCGLSSMERYKLLHPKAYGEYFVKLGTGREEWQRDWVACGGRPNGQYSDDAPPNATTKEIFAAIDKARKSLDSCMKSKGYEYRETQ